MTDCDCVYVDGAPLARCGPHFLEHLDRGIQDATAGRVTRRYDFLDGVNTDEEPDDD